MNTIIENQTKKMVYLIKRFSVPFNSLIKNSIVSFSIIFSGLAFFTNYAYAQNPDSAIKSLQTQINNARSDSSRVSLLLDMGLLCSKQPEKYQEYALNVDLRALKLCDQSNLTGLRNKCLLQTALQYGILKDFGKCRMTYMTVINLYTGVHDEKSVISTFEYLQSNFRRGRYTTVGMLNEAVFCLRRQRTIFLRLSDTLHAILALKNQGDADLYLGRLSTSENELSNVLKHSKGLSYEDRQDTYFMLGNISHAQGNLKKELDYRIRAVKLMTLEKNRSPAATSLYFKLARTYEDLGMYDSSLLYYDKSFTHASKNPFTWHVLLYRKALVMTKQNKAAGALNFLTKSVALYPPKNTDQSYFTYKGFETCYQALGQSQQAQYYLTKIVDSTYEKLHSIGVNNENILSDYKQVCEFYIANKNYAKANDFMKKIELVPQSTIGALTKSEIQFLKFKIDSALGNYLLAIKHFRLHKRLSDSINNITQADLIANIQIKNEATQKDKNIQLLTKQSELQKAGLKEIAMTRNVTFGGIIMLALMLTLGFNRYQLKQKSNQQLEVQQSVINKKNITLEQLVKDKDELINEKEWLLKEIHHRVKNNLQIVISLLNTQSAYLENSTAFNAIRESQNRMQSISLIHQKLYQSDNLAKIDMNEYIAELTGYIKDSLGIKANVQIILEIEPVFLDVEQAVPIGLILNEAVTNAIKYAFPNARTGMIKISLEELWNNELFISVKDDGCGFPEGFNIGNSTSLGLSLIKGLCKQLQGTVYVKDNKGVTIALTVPKTLLLNRQRDFSIGFQYQ